MHPTLQGASRTTSFNGVDLMDYLCTYISMVHYINTQTHPLLPSRTLVRPLAPSTVTHLYSLQLPDPHLARFILHHRGSHLIIVTRFCFYSSPLPVSSSASTVLPLSHRNATTPDCHTSKHPSPLQVHCRPSIHPPFDAIANHSTLAHHHHHHHWASVVAPPRTCCCATLQGAAARDRPCLFVTPM